MKDAHAIVKLMTMTDTRNKEVYTIRDYSLSYFVCFDNMDIMNVTHVNENQINK